jgi:hypothetical protein
MSLQEGRKARTRPVDWGRGRYGMVRLRVVVLVYSNKWCVGRLRPRSRLLQPTQNTRNQPLARTGACDRAVIVEATDRRGPGSDCVGRAAAQGASAHRRAEPRGQGPDRQAHRVLIRDRWVLSCVFWMCANRKLTRVLTVDVAVSFTSGRDGKRSLMPTVKAHFSVPKDKAA